MASVLNPNLKEGERKLFYQLYPTKKPAPESASDKMLLGGHILLITFYAYSSLNTL